MRTFVLAAAIAAAAVLPASPALASATSECVYLPVSTPFTGDSTTVCATYDSGCVLVWTNQLQTTKPIEVCTV